MVGQAKLMVAHPNLFGGNMDASSPTLSTVAHPSALAWVGNRDAKLPALLLLTLLRCPFRFNLHDLFTTRSIVTKTGPQPVFRTVAKLLPNRIAMDIAQLFVELLMAANIEIVVSGLPKVWSIADVLAGNALLERLNRNRERFHVRLAEEKMNVVRHHHVSVYTEPITKPDTFKCLKKGLSCFRVSQVLSAMPASEGDEVCLPRRMEAYETGWHGVKV